MFAYNGMCVVDNKGDKLSQKNCLGSHSSFYLESSRNDNKE